MRSDILGFRSVRGFFGDQVSGIRGDGFNEVVRGRFGLLGTLCPQV
jgi:hypothetical protein